MILEAWRRKLISCLLILCLAGNVCSLTIKLASPLPEATEWNNALLRMAEEWSEITDGLIEVKIYPGGIAGGEGEIVRKMRIGQLDAGVFSAFGLKAIVPETLVLTLPGLILDDRELNYILDSFTWRFEERFREEGFEILAWSQSGWAHIYSSKPISDIAELKEQRLAVDNTENTTVSIFKSLGFNIVPIGINETIIALHSGLVDSVAAPPMFAAAFQWFALAPYMSDLKLVPVIGGLVLSRRVWLQVPNEYHDALKASMLRVARDFSSASARLNDEAMAVMKDKGLEVVFLNEAAREEWLDAIMSWHSLFVGDGRAIPVEVYEKLLDEREKFRNK